MRNTDTNALRRELDIAKATATVLGQRLEALREEHDACESLRREIDHRAKNALHLASALLRTQSRSEPSGARRALTEAADRLAAMAALHDHYFHAGDQDTTSLTGCLQAVVRNFEGLHGSTIDFSGDDVACAPSQARSLALIANEAVMNAVKHRSPDRPLRVHLSFIQHDDSAEMAIVDDGEGFDGTASDTGFGLKVLQTLGRQLDAEVQILSEPGAGAAVRVTLPYRL